MRFVISILTIYFYKSSSGQPPQLFFLKEPIILVAPK